MRLQPFSGGCLALTDLVALIRVPSTRLVEDIHIGTDIDNFTFAGNTLAVDDLEFSLFERRRNFVLHHLHAGFVTQNFITLLDTAGTANIHTNRGVELQCVTAGGCFRRTVNHTDLLTNLVNEDNQSVGLLNAGSELTECLTHQTSLETREGFTHVAFNFRTRHQSRHGVDNDEVNGTGTNQSVCNFKSLFTAVRLRQEQVVHFNAEGFGVLNV